MNAWLPALQSAALCLSLLWLLLALATRPRSPLSVVWALFCGSIAMMLARGLVGPDAAPWYSLFGLGACLTCNGFWLVARALFRGGRPFGAPHLLYAGIVAALIIVTQQKAIAPAALIVVTGELLELLSSAALVMAFWEGLRGWPLHCGVERGMRIVFLATYGGCVALSFIAPALLDPAGTGAVAAASAATAAAAILLVTQGLVAWRLRHPLLAHVEQVEPIDLAPEDDTPLPESTDAKAKPEMAEEAATRAEDIALARSLEQHMRTHRPYLRTDLKLGHLAQALDVGEYRISRAVHGPLGHRNVSHYVNHYRLEYAQALLSNPANNHWSTLVIGLESGFGSLGAFHRAFKATEGCTPGEYRATRQTPVAVPSPAPASR